MGRRQDMRCWLDMLICEVSVSLTYFQVSCIAVFLTPASSDWYSQCIPGSGGGGSTTQPGPTTTSAGSTPTPTGGSGAGGELDTKFKAKGKLYFGTEIDHYHLNNQPLLTIAHSRVGQITAENSMKWDATERK